MRAFETSRTMPPSVCFADISPARGEIGPALFRSRLFATEGARVCAAPLHENQRPFLPHPPTPCHTHAAPVTGWTGNVPVQAGGRPPGVCRNVRQDEGGGGAPAGSAGSRVSLNGISNGMSNGRIGQASHRRNLCPLCRPAPAGCQGEGGNGPVAGRLADAGRASGAVSEALAFPDRQRKAQPVPDDATRR